MKNINFYKIYKIIFKFWKKKKILNFTKKSNKKYIILDGPPSLNGKPGVHHIFSRIIKDIYYRFYTINNYKVINKLGWDTHGLPIEIEVEKILKINKKDIGNKISINFFNNKCLKFIKKNLKIWKKFTNKIGYFLNEKNYYITCSNKYIETIRWIIKKIYNKNLLYKSYNILPYSPIAGTPISYQELNLPYTHKYINSLSIYVLFKLKKNKIFKYKKVYLLAWTTTPWTLPANSALLINKKFYYYLIKIYNVYNKKFINCIISKYYVKSFLKNKKYKILKKILGKLLIGLKYYQIINWFSPINKNKKIFIIINDNLNIIKKNIGTGIIHISPTFGKEDFEISKINNISEILYKNNKNKIYPIVDKNGKFIKNTPLGLGGKYINIKYCNKNNKYSVDKIIIQYLIKKKCIFKIKKYKHLYPHCWRTNKPIIYYPIKSWFINLKKIKNKIINLSKNINWCSSNLIKNKFYYWLKNIKNWNISRSRFWGTPLPIWKTKNEKKYLIIGSIKELNKEINKSIKLGFIKKNPFKKYIFNNKINYKKINLHSNIINNIILSSKDGKKMYKELDVIDVWFDSGVSQYAQYHYPFNKKKKKLIDNNIIFPSDFITEGIDQIRGWFFTLHTISCIISNKISYKNILPLGIILDKNGKKMSKSKGNTINPFKIIKNYGPDIIRWYLINNNYTWKNIKFNIKNIKKIKNKFFNTLYNIYKFYYNYSKLDNFNINKIYKNKYKYIDYWILSKLNNLLINVYNNYIKYNITYITRKINNFVIKYLSNWYIRLSRNRFWKKKFDNDKISAYKTLYICLNKILIISYPISPFFMEYLYIKINKKKTSIIIKDFPKYKKKLINNNIEKNMYFIKKYSKIILYLRKTKNIKVRQPLNIVYILKNNINKKFYKNKKILILLKKEVNIKKIKFINYKKINKYIIKKIKLNYKLLGPKFKNNIKNIEKYFNNISQKKINNLEKNKFINIFINNKIYKIYIYELFIEYININKNIIMYSKNNITIILNTKLTKILIYEGLIKDFIRKIQILRKIKNKKFNDNINIIIYNKNINNFINIINKYKKYILYETLSKNIIYKNLNIKKYFVIFKNKKIYFNII